MPKKSKPTQNDASASETVKTSRRRSTITKKKNVGKTATTARKTKAPKRAATSIEPTDEEIQLRAYFISERRHRLDLHGDTSSDWLEAKRQLLSEIGPR